MNWLLTHWVVWAAPLASLAAILLITWMVGVLGLGGDVRITDEATAIRLAREAGYDADEAVIDRWGTGALTHGGVGCFTVIRRTGVHFAARRLEAPIDGRLNQRWLTLTPDPHFGSVTLDLGDQAPIWAARLRHAT